MADSETGFDRAPDRYMGKGRETIDRMRDLAFAAAEGVYSGLQAATAKDVQDLANFLFVYHCEMTALKYEDRAGLKEGKAAEKDRDKARFYRMMVAHVADPDGNPDPRSNRSGFVPYARQKC